MRTRFDRAVKTKQLRDGVKPWKKSPTADGASDAGDELKSKLQNSVTSLERRIANPNSPFRDGFAPTHTLELVTPAMAAERGLTLSDIFACDTPGCRNRGHGDRYRCRAGCDFDYCLNCGRTSGMCQPAQHQGGCLIALSQAVNSERLALDYGFVVKGGKKDSPDLLEWLTPVELQTRVAELGQSDDGKLVRSAMLVAHCKWRDVQTVPQLFKLSLGAFVKQSLTLIRIVCPQVAACKLKLTAWARVARRFSLTSNRLLSSGLYLKPVWLYRVTQAVIGAQYDRHMRATMLWKFIR